MNTRILAAALSLAFAGTAFASEATLDTSAFVSTKSRAEVRAELIQARAAGLLQVNEADFVAVAPRSEAPAGKTRAEVIAETRAAVASGEFKALNAEALSYLPAATQKSMASALVIAQQN
jgi:Domain of unknown function (DUF4148)